MTKIDVNGRGNLVVEENGTIVFIGKKAYNGSNDFVSTMGLDHLKKTYTLTKNELNDYEAKQESIINKTNRSQLIDNIQNENNLNYNLI